LRQASEIAHGHTSTHDGNEPFLKSVLSSQGTEANAAFAATKPERTFSTARMRRKPAVGFRATS
jgi:hypothetical protein